MGQIELGPIVPKLLPNEGTWDSQYGWFCLPAGKRSLNPDRLPVDEIELDRAFKSVVNPLNYKLKQAADSVFEKNNSADLRLGGTVTKFHANLCYSFSGGPALIGVVSNLAKGNTFVEIKWELFDVRQQKVVYSFTTQGKFDSADVIPGGIGTMFLNAFAASLKNLAAERAFYNTLTETTN